MKKLFGFRILALFLCLVMMAAAFASCDTSGGDDSVSESDSESKTETTGAESPTVEAIPVANAVILTSATADADVTAAAQVLIDAIKEHMSVDATVKNDSELEDATKTEILVGATNRAQSGAALAKLNGQNGFVVTKSGNKIVINATHTAMLDDAVIYFVNNYVSGAAGASLAVPEDLSFVYGSTGGITLLGEDNTPQYKVIFSQNIDTKGGATDLEEGDYDTTTGVDYIYKFIGMLDAGLKEKIGTEIEVETDADTAEDENLEILVGSTNRPETKTFLKTLKVNEYGYGVVGNKLVIAGWGDYTSAMAIEAFLADCGNYLVDTEGDVKNFVMVEGERKVSAYERWNADVPLFKGGEMIGVIDSPKYGYYVSYENATVDAYKEYRKQLEAAGYTFWQENEIGDNLYATYYNSKAIIHTYHLGLENSVRVAVDHTSRNELPPNEDTSPNYGEKVNDDVTFTMHDFDGSKGIENWGNAFIITLEDGSFIFHDGGANEGSVEDEELYQLLKHLNKRKDGKIVIAAYILSHGHMDHHDGFDALMDKYGNDIILERIIHGEAGTTQIYNFYQNGHYATNSLEALAFRHQATVHRAHTGQTFQIRNLKVEAFFTVDTMFPHRVGQYNSSSLCTRFTVENGGETQSLLVLGDTQPHAAARLVQVYKDDLKCDILQVAHHGWGGSVDLYVHCAPSIVVWPGTYSTVNSHMKPTNSNGWAVINRALCEQENVVLVVVADKGHKTIAIPLLGLTEDEAQNEKLVVVTPRFDGKP